ncbi:MAG TPA: PilZ domain-containing protein [Gemmataceae bacterium]|nr:PilZ domain-containing protein [Gemmataceae bacterium]
MFVQTLESLPITFDERRRAARRRPAHNTVCRLTDLDGAEVGRGLVWNVSTTGISMLLNVRLEPGTLVGAELTSPAGETVPLRLNVVHLSRLRTGDYVLGGQFSRPLVEAELQPFVA